MPGILLWRQCAGTPRRPTSPLALVRLTLLVQRVFDLASGYPGDV